MSYFAQNGAMHGSGWSGKYVPPAKVTRVLCDACAIPEVPVEPVYYEVAYGPPSIHHYRQCRPWKWAPWYGGPCDTCGRKC